MLSTNLYSAFLFLPLLALAAPSQILLHLLEDGGIPQSLFNEFNDLAKIVDITNCLQTVEGISYPFECNSFCKEFPELKLVKQWNTNKGSNLAEEGSSGYVAVDHDGRKIIVAAAGSYSGDNTSVTAVDYNPLLSGHILGVCPGCKVHGGFYNNWIKTEELIGDIIEDLARRYIEAEKKDPYQLVLVGGSSGGAVAVLAAVDFEAKGWNPQITTFGQPKVGNEAFTDYLTGRFTPSTYRRVTHVSDPAPQFPPDEAGFSHFEHVYFISKPFVPYGPSDVLVCNTPSDPTCVSPSLGLDWTPSDYFHHTDSCIRETVSFFSILTLEFDILEPLDKAKRANLNPGFHTSLEAFGRAPVPGDGGNIRKQATTVNRPVSTVLENKFRKSPRFAGPEFGPGAVEEGVSALGSEDEGLYASVSGSAKAQAMQTKPAPQKRSITLNPDSDITPSTSLKNALAMLEEEADNPQAPIEYEDEEIYHKMAGFSKAQEMWIKKPQGAVSKQKTPSEFIDRETLPKEYPTEKKDPIVGLATDFGPIKMPSEAVYTDPVTKDAEWGPGTEQIMYSTAKDGNGNVYILPDSRHTMYLQNLDPKSTTVVGEVEEPGKDIESGGLKEVLEKRDFERAIRFFNAPKHVLDAQLAVNQEAALYNAQQRAAMRPDVEENEGGNPDEDYFKKGGSVLIMNGRPLEVDGQPVLYEPPAPKGQWQKRSQISPAKSSHGPGLGVKRGVRPGILEGKLQNGKNVVYVNGKPMPPNFVHKSVVEGERPVGDNLEKRDYLPFSHYSKALSPKRFSLGGYAAPGSRCHPGDHPCTEMYSIPCGEPAGCGLAEEQVVDMVDV